MADDPDDGDSEDGPPFPWTVRAAGVIWGMFGGVWLLGWIACVAVLGGAGVHVCTCGFAAAGLAVGAGIVHAGINAFFGETPDPLRNAVGSIVIGLAFYALAWLLAADTPPGPEWWQSVTLTAMTPAGIGTLLVAAGVLALGGRGQYLAWKADRDAPAEEMPDDGGNESEVGPE